MFIYYNTNSYSENCAESDAARPSRKKVLLELLGMPGAGKSTCVDMLKEYYSSILHTVYTNEEIPVTGTNQKFEFNSNIIQRLKQVIQDGVSSKFSVLDRGTIDVGLWIKIHEAMSNNSSINHRMNKGECDKLRKLLSAVSTDTLHFQIAFIQSSQVTMTRRVAHRHAADDWALSRDYLETQEHFYNEHIEKARKLSCFYCIESGNLSLQEQKEQFSNIIADIRKRANI